jgi:hypothetical protein
MEGGGGVRYRRGWDVPGDRDSMSRPTVKEVNFVDFKRMLQKAIADGTRVERSDKVRWEAFIQKHHVKEAGFSAYVRGQSETLKPVIIAEPDPNAGYYLCSERDELCLKWVPRAAE